MLHEKNGYSFIETLITFFIVSVCIMTVFKTAIFVIKANDISKMTSIASTIAQSRIEKIKEGGFSNLLEGTYTEIDLQHKITTKWTVKKNFPTLNTASVSVISKWIRGKNEKKIILSTIMGK